MYLCKSGVDIEIFAIHIFLIEQYRNIFINYFLVSPVELIALQQEATLDPDFH